MFVTDWHLTGYLGKTYYLQKCKNKLKKWISRISSWWHFKMRMNILTLNFTCVFELVPGSNLTTIYFIFHSVLIWRPELNIEIIERFSSSSVLCGVRCDQIFRKFSITGSRFRAQSARNRFSQISSKILALAEPNYGPFVFLARAYVWAVYTYSQKTKLDKSTKHG